MIRLDVTITAEHPDELAEAFEHLAARGMRLGPAGDQAPSRAVASVTDLVTRRRGEAHA